MCNFLYDRKARIKLETFLGDSFDIRCGVPQGSVLSPMLFILYWNDTPAATRGINLSYADDVTQISGYPGPSHEMAHRRNAEQINFQNTFEHNWHINTNATKFSVLNLGARRHEHINTNTRVIQTTHHGSLLGLSITGNGYSAHVQKRCGQAKTTLVKLYRFRQMPTKIKLHLVKTLTLPILDYTPIPTHSLSKTQISKLQELQNKALRFATNQQFSSTQTNEQIHINTKTLPVNVRLHRTATQIWEKIAYLDIPLHTTLMNNLPNITRFHRYFPSSLHNLQTHPNPEPKFY